MVQRHRDFDSYALAPSAYLAVSSWPYIKYQKHWAKKKNQLKKKHTKESGAFLNP